MHVAAHLVGAWPMTVLRLWQLLYAFALLLSLCCFTPAFAATWRDGGGWSAAPLSQGGDGVWSVLPDASSPNNSHVTTCTASSCNRSGDLPAPRGRGNPRLTPTASFPKGSIAVGALALGSRALPWLTAGKALYDWYQAAGVRFTDDGFQESTQQDLAILGSGVWRCNASHVACANAAGYGTPDAACRSASSVVTGTYVRASTSNGGQFYSCVFSTGTFYSVYKNASCSFGSPDSSGVCPYTSSWVPTTEASALAKLENAPITADVLKRALEEVLKAGGSVSDTGTHTVTGPSSVPGETKTKTATSANGTAQVTTVTNNYNYNYVGNTVTITTTEVIQNPDGSTETTTSDTPDPLCAQNPNSLACIKLGDVPTDQPAWETKTIAYQADSLGLPAACPAPWTGQLRGWTLSFSYQPACDVAPQVRLAILALTTLGALLMIITTVRT